MRRSASREALKKMSVDDRVQLARAKARQMHKYVVNLMQTHSSNQIILFTDILSSQIGKSYAAHAFNDFQSIMYFGEIARTIALWDGLDLEKCSFPTIVEIVNEPLLLRSLYRDYIEHAFNNARHMTLSG